MRGTSIQQIQITAQPVTAAPPASPGTESREVAVAMPPGVAPVGHSGSARPDGTARPAAPRPGMATARSAIPAAAAPRPAGPAASAANAAAPAPARPEKPAPPEKPDNGGRFNLLEID
jgi:hypothetical protein